MECSLQYLWNLIAHCLDTPSIPHRQGTNHADVRGHTESTPLLPPAHPLVPGPPYPSGQTLKTISTRNSMIMEECLKVLLKTDFLKSKKNSRKTGLSDWSNFKQNPPKAANQAEQTRLWIKANSCEFQVDQWLIAAPQGLEALAATKLSSPKCKLTHPLKSCWTSSGAWLQSIHRIPDKLVKIGSANVSSRIRFKGVIQISLIPPTVQLSWKSGSNTKLVVLPWASDFLTSSEWEAYCSFPGCMKTQHFLEWHIEHFITMRSAVVSVLKFSFHKLNNTWWVPRISGDVYPCKVTASLLWFTDT